MYVVLNFLQNHVKLYQFSSISATLTGTALWITNKRTFFKYLCYKGVYFVKIQGSKENLHHLSVLM